MNRVGWPFIVQPLPAPIKFDALWCSEDNRIRVATIGKRFYVSINGDSFTGPCNTFEAARQYGEQMTGEGPDRPDDCDALGPI